MTFEQDIEEMAEKFEGVWCPKFMKRLRETLTDSRLKAHLDQAKANGLKPLEVPMYIEAYILSTETENECGIATIAHYRPWKVYLQDIIDEVLPLSEYDNKTLSKPKPKQTASKGEKESYMKTGKSDMPQGAADVSAKEGDACRREVRKLADELGYELTETGGAVTCTGDGEVVAQCAYKRGTKSGAWKQVYEQLEVLM